MKKEVLIIIIVVIAVLSIGVYFLFMQKSPTTPTSQMPTDDNEVVEQVAMDDKKMEASDSGDKMATAGATVGEVVEIEVTSEGLAFTPKEIRVKKGAKVRLTYKNTKGSHDFVIDEFKGAKTKQIAAGESDTVEFVVDKAGEYEFYCSVPGHRAAGMKGAFIVE